MNLKPIMLIKINTVELSITHHKLDQYSEDLDKLIQEPSISKHNSWFTYFTTTVVVVIITILIQKTRQQNKYRCKIRKLSEVHLRLQVENEFQFSEDSFPQEASGKKMKKSN